MFLRNRGFGCPKTVPQYITQTRPLNVDRVRVQRTSTNKSRCAPLRARVKQCHGSFKTFKPILRKEVCFRHKPSARTYCNFCETLPLFCSRIKLYDTEKNSFYIPCTKKVVDKTVSSPEFNTLKLLTPTRELTLQVK